MNLPRKIFLWDIDLKQSTIKITDERLRRRLRDVLRLVPGDEVIFLNDRAEEGRFSYLNPRDNTFRRIETYERTLTAKRRLTLAVAMPKRDALALLIQRAAELGVAVIQPLITERSNLKLTENSARWQALIGEALEVTSWRETPVLRQPSRLDSFLERLTEPCFLFERMGVAFNPAEAPLTLTLCLGPEGGWSEAERLTLAQSVVTTVSLGQATFRTETAALLALALLNFS